MKKKGVWQSKKLVKECRDTCGCDGEVYYLNCSHDFLGACIGQIIYFMCWAGAGALVVQHSPSKYMA
jgi:hypothetical protein